MPNVVFNKNWTAKYLFTELGGEAVCLVCWKQITVIKEHVIRHNETKHLEKYKNLTADARAQESEALLDKLQKQDSPTQGCCNQEWLSDIPHSR